MATVFHEVERKYDAAEAGSSALDAVGAIAGDAGVASVSRQQEEVLDAVYYDTEDLRLIRGGVTLRQRTGGTDAGWHLKLPAGADTRDEIRLPLGQASVEPAGPERPAAVPKELADLVRARSRAAPLVPVAHVRTSRYVLLLLDQAGRPLAEVSADHVSADQADGSASTSWDEIEVELAQGGQGLLEAVEKRLSSAGARPAAAGTKLERAIGERLRAAREAAGSAGTAADRASAPHLTRRSPAGEVVLAYLRRQAHAIVDYDPLVRRDEPDAVHQMRVATRRARSALQAFGGVVDKASTTALRDELKWLATVLGRARDAEVLLARFTSDLEDLPAELVTGPVLDRISGHFTVELSEARDTALRALDGQRYLAILGSLDSFIAGPPLAAVAAHEAGQILAKPVRRAARRLKRALADVPDAADTDAAIHEARKAAKRARYAAEAAEPALGRKARRRARGIKKLQTVLGDHHDSVVARTVLLSLADQARAAGEDTFTYGVMYGRQVCQAREIERGLQGAPPGP